MGSCQIAALYDDDANEIIGVDGKEESVIYMSVVGYPPCETVFREFKNRK
jgi:hypothetical protein